MHCLSGQPSGLSPHDALILKLSPVDPREFPVTKTFAPFIWFFYGPCFLGVGLYRGSSRLRGCDVARSSSYLLGVGRVALPPSTLDVRSSSPRISCNRGQVIGRMSRHLGSDIISLDYGLRGVQRVFSDELPAFMYSKFVPPGLVPVGGLILHRSRYPGCRRGVGARWGHVVS